MRKWTKHENARSLPFSYHVKMAADINTGMQSINTESLFKCFFSKLGISKLTHVEDKQKQRNNYSDLL